MTTMEPIRSIVLLGAGNVAFHLGTAFKQAGLDVLQVYSRTMHSAKILAHTLGCQATNQLSELTPGADIYIISVTDDAIADVVREFPHHGSFLVHTSGSISIDVLSACTDRYGVFYPLQTFSKGISIDYTSIPVCLESVQETDSTGLERFARLMTNSVHWVNSDKRRQLHIAAVFACNFVNHMYAMAADVAGSAALPFELLRPLIRETARKALMAEPQTVQTGPARRKNHKVIETHLSLLSGSQSLQRMYKLISEDIMNTYLGKE